jgi:glycosyltransferase involved in cell wall biosynthesis
MPPFVDWIVVVDDASRDRTAAIATAAAGARAIVLRHPDNVGVGAAITTGYRYARKLGADVVAVMAGDGQMDPADLGRVLAPAVRGHAEYVKGNRLRHPDVWSAMPIHRIVATALFGWLTRRAAGLARLSDSQCGFTAMSASAIDAIDLDRIWPSYGYPNDLIGAVTMAGMRVAEVVVRPVYRGEASGLRPWHLATIAFVIGRVASRRWAAERGALERSSVVDQPMAVAAAEGATPCGSGTHPSRVDDRARPTSVRTPPVREPVHRLDEPLERPAALV